ncbi:hypothetical protein, partial [Pseudonocardia sp.]|uniref:hypothetical protein n=1 Tax=Pseudonocardia sp. TaxID=60912 RepID=UPI002B4B6898
MPTPIVRIPVTIPTAAGVSRTPIGNQPVQRLVANAEVGRDGDHRQPDGHDERGPAIVAGEPRRADVRGERTPAAHGPALDGVEVHRALEEGRDTDTDTDADEQEPAVARAPQLGGASRPEPAPRQAAEDRQRRSDGRAGRRVGAPGGEEFLDDSLVRVSLEVVEHPLDLGGEGARGVGPGAVAPDVLAGRVDG